MLVQEKSDKIAKHPENVIIDELGLLDGLQTLSYFGQKQDSWYVLSIMQSAFLQYPVCYKCVF